MPPRTIIRTILAAATLLLAAAPSAQAQIQIPGLPICGLPGFPACPNPNPPRPPQPPPRDVRGVNPASPNPLRGERFYVDRTGNAPQYRAYLRYLARGETTSAALVSRIALRPQFKWFGRWNERQAGGIEGQIRRYLLDVYQGGGGVPQIVVMRHQGRACHKRYTAGGAAEDERTRRWYRAFARGVGSARVVIGFEPDSLGTVDCLAKSRRRARLDLLRYGVDVVSQLPNATVYLEAGASDWEHPGRTAKQLRYIGISKVRGFMLNVTHYDWTANNIRHGRRISAWTGGKPFIISTSFNGRGPVSYRRWISRANNRWRRVTVWCHPLKRGLGIAPTTQTHDPKADGYLYIGRPGYSGGSCNGGPLPVGSWFGDRALMFSRYATAWLRPPRGHRFGLPGGVSLKSVAGDQLIR